jgi:hypothetical protein
MPTQLEGELLSGPLKVNLLECLGPKLRHNHMPSGHPWQNLQITIVFSGSLLSVEERNRYCNNHTKTALRPNKIICIRNNQYSTDPKSHAEACNMTKQKHSRVTDMQAKAACTRLGRENTTDEHLLTNCTICRIHTWQYASTECNSERKGNKRYN